MKYTNYLFALLAAVVLTTACRKGSKNPAPSTPETANQLPILAGETIFNTLPKQVAFGVQATPGYYAQVNDMDIKYRYAYLTGNPMDASGWQKWNAPDGAYALMYMQNAANAGVTPVLTYYTIVPIKYYADPATDKLADAAVMKAYLEDWRVLMQKCGEFNKTVVVHYEPDFTGYLQRLVADKGDDPAGISVQVKSSGFTDSQINVGNYADNAKGLFQLIKALRDQYAPKALLGYQISHWATGTDFIVNKTDPVATAKRTIGFYKKLEADFDLIFSEFSDRDAAWYEKHKGVNRWWADADFESFRLFLKEAHESTGKRVFLWQVPSGNTKYKACDNTEGHFQDNRAEFFFEEINAGKNDRLLKYAQAGVIAYLFGHGATGCTSPYDEENDEIVNNPAPINGNTRDAINGSKDDEGGYIRHSIKKYNDPLNKTVITFK